MELNLDDSSQSPLPVITKLVIHDDTGKSLFSLNYDPVSDDITFLTTDNSDFLDLVIQSKSTLTQEKGVEAFGTFVDGAEQELPVYQHLLSVYLPAGQTVFTKYHLTIYSSLEHINFESSLLLAAECYSVLYDPLQEYLQTGSITTQQYPLLQGLFFRTYSFDPFNQLMNNTGLDGAPLQDSAIIDAHQQILAVLEKFNSSLHSAGLLIMTASGAIMGHSNFLNHPIERVAIDQISHSMIRSPGIFTSNGNSTLWFPFTKSKVGKITRAFDTTLNTLNYASEKREIQEQVQTNIAHKFHDLVDVIADYIKYPKTHSMGLQTNVGYLVATLGFEEDVQNDLSTILEVSHQVSNQIKIYGQAILSHIAKAKQFELIID